MTHPSPAAVIIPTLNEAHHIEPLLAGLLAEPEDAVGEILVADGGSTDGTRDIVRRFAALTPRVRLVDNPKRIQAAGINRAVALADPRLDRIVRIDAHADYPPGYVARLLASLRKHGADSVVVRLETVGDTPIQRAIAAASNSRLGTGGAAHRMGGVSRFVDHGHHAAFRRTVFEQAGGYDERFEANEDAELDVRIRATGGRIWLDAAIPVRYHPRRSLLALRRQYWRYGLGRARTFLKHRERLRLRQMVSPLTLVAVVSGLAFAPLAPVALMLPFGYAAAIGLAAAHHAWRVRSLEALLIAPTLAVMHLSWGSGFVAGVLAGSLRLDDGNAAPTRQALARG